MAEKKIIDVEKALRSILAKDPRYPIEAYIFVREALDHTMAIRNKAGHVRGQELLTGMRALAIEQFGPLTLPVFHNWGVRRTEDIGEIVFNMVEIGILGKTEEDSREDFVDGFDFEDAFGNLLLIDEDFRL